MKTIISFLLICSCLTAIAQDDKKLEFFPEMSRGAGVSFQKFDGLNDRIAGFPQYKQIRNATGVLQLGTFKESHQFISQMNLMAGSSMSGDRSEKSSTIRYLGAGIDIGYDFIKSEKVALFPLIGLGYQAYQARFFRDNSAVDFDNVLQSTTTQNNIKPLDLTNGFFNYRLGIGLAATSAKYHCSIGVQAMYVGSFQDRAWRSGDAQTLSNAPSDGLSQIYAGLVLTCRPFFMMKRGHM
jgi:hypothetical protein